MTASESLSADRLPPADAAPEAVEAPPPPRADWWAEARGLVWLVLIVLGFHSFVAKPFYIPSESMLPGLRIGDRLVVSKYAYGYSYVTPTFHVLPFVKGRLFGRMPARGDVVIVFPPGGDSDYIKRVIGLPGDRIAVRGGLLYLNGVAVPRERLGDMPIPVDANTRCESDPGEPNGSSFYAGRRERLADGTSVCRLPVFRETLPGGASYEIVDLGLSAGDNYAEIRVPRDHVFLMGDNRDLSADSRFSTGERGLGGPVPWENIGGRAEFVTFSVDGTATWNPLSWWGSLRAGRTGVSLHPQREER